MKTLFLLQLTRNSFPEHALEVLKNCNFVDTLRDGFRKTGLHPFCPTTMLNTVKHIGRADDPTSPSPPTLSPQKRKLREIMSNMNVPDASIETLVEQTVRAARGESAEFHIAKSLHKALLETNPKKKRMLKDQRLSTDSGLLLTSSLGVAALNEQENAKKKKPAPKRRAAKK